MDWLNLHDILVFIQHGVSLIGILIIISGVLLALFQYMNSIVSGHVVSQTSNINAIRLNLGRVLILGLEFIVAADLIGTTTTPDYYAVGLLAIIVLVRTILSFSINRELMSISKEP
ncbi:hypothetical protein AQUSIP_20860 [Aquicella siphonis]|uniref:DUF1622 domain-containing protein n=1 Tax=Aquicella siphonis TaxID=254247 RepID=A0A5E4PI77_9COXI|nr:DUF1622 domain-containing protein [Aquicella siphonis]VVC76760.1 hypothetical protein AQUSIP_20860 [Aquicella siphonis]